MARTCVALSVAFVSVLLTGTAIAQTATGDKCAPTFDNANNRWVMPCAKPRFQGLKPVSYDGRVVTSEARSDVVLQTGTTQTGAPQTAAPQTGTTRTLNSSAMTQPGLFNQDLGPGLFTGSRLVVVGGRDTTKTTAGTENLSQQTNEKSFFTGLKLSFPLN